MATGAGEYSREMLRKPYVIGRWMYSNGVRVPYVSRINAAGISGSLELGMERRPTPATRAARPSSAASAAPATPSTATGRWRSCSTDATAPTSRASSPCCTSTKPDSPYRHFMPPMVGTRQDVDDLTDFLNAQVNPPMPSAPRASAHRAKVALREALPDKKKARGKRAFFFIALHPIRREFQIARSGSAICRSAARSADSRRACVRQSAARLYSPPAHPLTPH